MKYAEQIKSPKWQKKRLEILKRDEFTCQECGNKELTLHVHHKHYNKGAKIWEYENWELTTLCEICHNIQHNEQKNSKTIIDDIIPECQRETYIEFIEKLNEFDKNELSFFDTNFIFEINSYLDRRSSFFKLYRIAYDWSVMIGKRRI